MQLGEVRHGRSIPGDRSRNGKGEALPNLCLGVPVAWPDAAHTAAMTHSPEDHDDLRGLVTEIAARATVAVGLAGFVVNRTVGLPNAMDDIGNWTESLGLAAHLVEGALVALAGSVLMTRMSARSQAESGLERTHLAQATAERRTATTA